MRSGVVAPEFIKHFEHANHVHISNALGYVMIYRVSYFQLISQCSVNLLLLSAIRDGNAI